MNPVTARLALTGARSSAGRLAGIAGGVAIGVCLILLLWAAAQGLSDRDQRAAWLREEGRSPFSVPADVDGTATEGQPQLLPLTAETILVGRADDVFQDRLIQRRDIAATENSTVHIPGIGSAPQPGTYYASPALQKLIETTPVDQLGDRYGTYAGTIDDTALAGPDSLVVITGATEDQLRQTMALALVSDFTSNPYGDNATTYATLMALGGIAVLFPVLLLISISTRLGATQRTERFATLRLIGATPRTVAGIAAAETAVPALLGAVAGVAAASILRPVTAQVPVGESRLYVHDLAAGPVLSTAVVVLVVSAAIAAAAWGTARAGIGPLGAARARREPTPRAWRALPLLTGLAAMTAAVVVARVDWPWAYAVVQLLLILGFALTTVGLVVIGPWLTLLVSRIGLARASSAAAVIAAGRIRSTPVATFRAVSGLVVAVFMVSAFAGASSAVDQAELPPARPGLMLPTSVYAYLGDRTDPAEAQQVATRIETLPGISSTAVLYDRPASASGSGSDDSNVYLAAEDASGLGFEDPVTGPVAVFDDDFFTPWAEQPLPLKTSSLQDVNSLQLFAVVINTDGTAEAIDRARTALNTSGITSSPATSRADVTATQTTRLIHSLSVLAHLGTFVAVIIAGISLAVATGAAIIDRRRALGLMRLMGMPLSALRGIIVREAAVPLLSILLLSAALGFLAAWLVVESLHDTYSVSWPGQAYFATLGLSMALALAAVAATFTLLRANTSITATRFE
ncbi:ABC transporter permease [Kocuria sabuli]|uniref:ABC transporter permease n=1 Tax=Kocuria sabuli TaxID=3071448 RepID=UPI0034D5D029